VSSSLRRNKQKDGLSPNYQASGGRIFLNIRTFSTTSSTVSYNAYVYWSYSHPWQKCSQNSFLGWFSFLEP